MVVAADDGYLKFSKVSKKYGSKLALQDFSMEIKPGERVALLGINGAGKSTILNLATGIRRPSGGQLSLFGGRPSKVECRQSLGYLPQELKFPPFLKVGEIVKTVSRHFQDPLNSILEKLNIHPLMNKSVGSLSGGQHRRVALGCSLIGSPRLSLLDEPTGGMDLSMRSQTFKVLREYLDQRERAVLFSTHHMDEVEKLAERVVVVHHGKIITNGSVDEIKERFGLCGVFFKGGFKSLILEEAKSLSEHGGLWKAYGNDSDKLLKEIIKKVPDARDIQLKEPSLEEVFLTLTGGDH